jgi:hypothetical protein
MRATERPRLGATIAVGLGILAIVAATVVGWNGAWLDAVVAPPPIVRAALVGGAVALGALLLARSVGRMAEAGAHPLPLVVAAVIAGIDVIETSFLLLVVGRGR